MKGHALEELLYWLCEAVGAQDLEWRAGSATGTSRDRGRDLEATFHVSEPGGALRPERWWIQAKGRASTVPAGVIREAVVDAQAHAEVDVLVIATNTRVTNDTRDWVAEFQQKHPRPSVRLWEQPDLERMLVDHPSVVARVTPEALSLAGQLAAASAAYWNRLQLPSHGQLDRFWESRMSLEFATADVIMLIVAEAARGGLMHHPWGADLDVEAVSASLVLAMANLAPLLLRGERIGHDAEPLRLAVAHLAACGLTRLPADLIAQVLDDPWRFLDDDRKLDGEAREQVRRFIIKPVIDRLRTYFGSACMTDCVRVSGELEPEPDAVPERRWFELLHSDNERPATHDGRLFMFEELSAPCRAGLPLDEERHCPFGGADRDVSTKDFLTDLQLVIAHRLAQVTSRGDDAEQAGK
jgi:hypothetical protein